MQDNDLTKSGSYICEDVVNDGPGTCSGKYEGVPPIDLAEEFNMLSGDVDGMKVPADDMHGASGFFAKASNSGCRSSTLMNLRLLISLVYLSKY
jgi:hypothetical protein